VIKSDKIDSWAIDPYYQSNSILDHILSVFMRYFQINVECNILHGEIQICYPKRLNEGQPYEYIIIISADTFDWAQTIYQLAHEISHLIMECYPDNQKYKWISECLCEAASLFIINEISIIWNKEPYDKGFIVKDSNIPYAVSLKGYLENKISKIKIVSSLKDYYNENAEWFANDPCADEGVARPRNDVFALYFYNLIRENPSCWTTISYMSDKMLPDDSSIIDYLGHWERNCISKLQKEFVLSFRNSIGL
jgi:hypothetical protein